MPGRASADAEVIAASVWFEPCLPNTDKVLVRVFVSDLDAVIPFYEALTESAAERFGFREVALACVGRFLLSAGNTASYRDRTATVLEEPSPASNGDRLIAKHPDGSILEYIESGPSA